MYKQVYEDSDNSVAAQAYIGTANVKPQSSDHSQHHVTPKWQAQ